MPFLRVLGRVAQIYFENRPKPQKSSRKFTYNYEKTAETKN